MIDAKRYKDAEISVERTGGLFTPVNETLKVGSRRKNDLVDAVHKLCDVVKGALSTHGHPDVPVLLVLCFVGASLPLREKNRRVRGVRLCGPKGLAEIVTAEGALADEARFAVAMSLSTALPSMT